MIWPTRWLLRRFVADSDRVADQKVRLGHVRLECWVSILGNLLIGSAKIALGVYSGSIALIADACHTYGDMASSVVLLVSMKVAVRPPDGRHPYGHGRAEAIGTLILAGMLIVTAVEFAHQSVDRLISPQVIEFAWWIIPALVAFWAAKEWMARFSLALGKRISSEALAADAFHHRSDAWATLLVVLSFIGTALGYPWLDGLFGLGVVALVGWAGARFAWSMMSALLGEAPSRELAAQIVSTAAEVRGVRGVHGVEVHDYGSIKIASLHVEVTGGLDTAESHRVATLVEEALDRRLGLSAVVHVEVSEGSSRARVSTSAVEEVLRSFVVDEPHVRGYHAVHVVDSGKDLSVDLHLTVEPGLHVEECHRMEHDLQAKLAERMGSMKANVHCEPAGGA